MGRPDAWKHVSGGIPEICDKARKRKITIPLGMETGKTLICLSALQAQLLPCRRHKDIDRSNSNA